MGKNSSVLEEFVEKRDNKNLKIGFIKKNIENIVYITVSNKTTISGIAFYKERKWREKMIYLMESLHY